MIELASISDSLSVLRGHVNVGVITDGDRVLLIDLGDPRLLDELSEQGIGAVDTVLYTHHHRDSACGALVACERGAKIVVPADEKQWFDNVESYWNDPKHRWHLYEFHPHHLMLTESVRVDQVLSDGDVFEWGPARITAISTPGHTDGSLTYLVEVDGRGFAFTGDLIYDAGKLWEIHSLQKVTETVNEYQGFWRGRGTLIDSLSMVREFAPDALIPTHGEVMTDPLAAIDATINQIHACYDSYAQISALRYYSPDEFTDYDGSFLMPMGPLSEFPDCLTRLLPADTTLVLKSETGAAFVMDCRLPTVTQELKRLVAKGDVNSVEGIWITHYHDDHVDGLAEFQAEFDCELVADESVAEVIADPLSWRIPCVSPVTTRVDRRTRNGDTWKWHEFTMTAYHFPGQALHHGGLLVEKPGLSIFFVGDSFTPSGIDDYCVYNRNFLGGPNSLDRCVEILAEIKPDLLVNPHVEKAWSFSDEHYAVMKSNLTARKSPYDTLIAWDDCNFGLDDQWAFCHPYEQSAAPGGSARLDVVVANHSSVTRSVGVRPVLPAGWVCEGGPVIEGRVLPKEQGRFGFRIALPDALGPGRHVLAVDVRIGDRLIPQIAEAIVVTA